MTWVHEKFYGDAAIYAFCPNCNFHHMAGSTLEIEKGIGQYNYCPMCGEHLYDDNGETEVIWNKRNIEELWELESGADVGEKQE